MNLLKTKPLWLKGGGVGVLICLMLTFFFLLLFRVLFNYFDPLPTWLIYPPIITGHAFLPLVMYHFDGSGSIMAYGVGALYIFGLSFIYFLIGALIGLILGKIGSKR